MCTHLCVVFEHAANIGHPRHVKLERQVEPLGLARLLDKAAVLCRETNVLDVTEMLGEERLISARDDVDEVPGIVAKCLEGLEQLF